MIGFNIFIILVILHYRLANPVHKNNLTVSPAVNKAFLSGNIFSSISKPLLHLADNIHTATMFCGIPCTYLFSHNNFLHQRHALLLMPYTQESV